MKSWKIFIFSLALYVQDAICASQVVDKIAAIVNNSIILDSDVDKMLIETKLGAKETNQQLPDDTTLRRLILDKLIMDHIILQLAKHKNIIINDEQLDTVIRNIATKNHITINQLYRILANNGVDYNTYRATIRKELLINEVRNNEVRRRVTIVPQEVESLAKQITAQTSNNEEFNLSHILIPLPENPSQNQVEKIEILANSLLKQIKNGADFVKLATTYSTNLKISKGIQMGWRKLEELPSLFATCLQSVHKGSIVGPIRSNAGFHILKVNDIRGGNRKSIMTEIHIQHILLRTSIIMTDQQVRAKLEDIASKINNGYISFNAAAKQLSEESGGNTQSRDLGWISADDFDPTFRYIIMHLKKGAVSMPIHSLLGWYLIQLIDIRQVDRTNTVQKNRAYRLLFKRKFSEEIQTWMQEHRASAYVKIIDNNYGI